MNIPPKRGIFPWKFTVVLVIAFGVYFNLGYLRSLKSEVTSLRKEVSTLDLELFSLKNKLKVFEGVEVNVHLIDLTKSVEVIAVTDYFVKEKE